MIVYIKDYSFKTGKGKAVQPDGKEIDFTYKNFVDKQAVPAGNMAEMKNGKITPAGKTGKLSFFYKKLTDKIRRMTNAD